MKNNKLLIVDDEPLVLDIFESFFKFEKFSIHTCGSASCAISQLRSTNFDIVICDLMLDSLDGFDVLQFAKTKNPLGKYILITGSPSELDKDRAKRMGFDYFIKPIAVDSLVKSVKNICDKKMSNA